MDVEALKSEDSSCLTKNGDSQLNVLSIDVIFLNLRVHVIGLFNLANGEKSWKRDYNATDWLLKNKTFQCLFIKYEVKFSGNSNKNLDALFPVSPLMPQPSPDEFNSYGSAYFCCAERNSFVPEIEERSKTERKIVSHG